MRGDVGIVVAIGFSLLWVVGSEEALHDLPARLDGALDGALGSVRPQRLAEYLRHLPERCNDFAQEIAAIEAATIDAATIDDVPGHLVHAEAAIFGDVAEVVSAWVVWVIAAHHHARPASADAGDTLDVHLCQPVRLSAQLADAPETPDLVRLQFGTHEGHERADRVVE
jgi:hypothetical protein